MHRVARVFYGWRVVGIGALLFALAGGLYQQASTVLLLPISRDLQLSRGAASFIFALARAEAGLTAPATGWLIDRLGPRRMIVGGAVVAGLGYVWLAQVQDFLLLVVVYAFVAGVGFQAIPSAAMSLANHWFVRGRGLAIASVTAGVGVGGAIFLPLLGLSVDVFGWRPSVVFSGLFVMLASLPLMLAVRDRPEDVGLFPDGDGPLGEDSRATERYQRPELTVRQGLRSRAFWLFVAGTTGRTMAQNTIGIHLVPMLVWKGLSEPAAAGMVGLLALLTVPLRLGIAWYGDRTSKKAVLGLAMLAGALGTISLILTDSLLYVGPFILLLAISEGAPGLNWALLGDLVGRNSFASLRGVTNTASQFGVVGLPILAGWTFDQTQSYAWTLGLASALFVLATGLFWFASPSLPAASAEARLKQRPA